MNGNIPRMDYRQYRAARRLVHECCNYDSGNCLLLEDGEPCVCVQSISYSLLCRWFTAAVLPLDEALEGKGMSIVNVYWFCLLALEYVALFCQSYLQTSWNSWIIALWIIAMIGNVFAAVYCIRTFLNNMISYENLYFPKQEVTVC